MYFFVPRLGDRPAKENPHQAGDGWMSDRYNIIWPGSWREGSGGRYLKVHSEVFRSLKQARAEQMEYSLVRHVPIQRGWIEGIKDHHWWNAPWHS